MAVKFLGILAFFLALPAAAAEYRESGDWVFSSVAVAESGGAMIEACTASTTSADGTELGVTLTPVEPEGFGAEIRLGNEAWDFSGGPVQVRFDIGGTRWMLPGEGTGQKAVLPWAGGGAILSFLEALASSSAAGLVGGDGQALAQFSLRGSRGAIEAVKACVEGQTGQALEASVAGDAGNPF